VGRSSVLINLRHFFSKMWLISCALVIRDCYYLPPLSQLIFSFTVELSASGIVVLCSDQKFINITHENIDIKIEIRFFFQKSNRKFEIDRNF